MTRHLRDENIRVALGRLRADDERLAPPFERILTGARADQIQPASRSTWPVPVAIAATVLVAVGAYLSMSRPRMAVPEEVIALSAWRPATDVLLDTPGRRLLTHAPQLGASLIDIPGGIPR